MLKIIRWLLYSLAISTGAGGLFAGGVPLVNYALHWLSDHDYIYYYNPNYLFSPAIIFLLSVILLVFVHISFLVGRGIHINGPAESVSFARPEAHSPATSGAILPAAQVAGTSAPASQETADEKLARLLNQKND